MVCFGGILMILRIVIVSRSFVDGIFVVLIDVSEVVKVIIV